MSIPLLDVSAAHAELGAEIESGVLEVLRSGSYVGGPGVQAFEDEWGRFVDAEHCIGVGNGLDALTLALRAAGIGPGDEVIVPAHTFIATWLAVTAVGARPVAIDVGNEEHLMDATSITDAIGRRTKAVIPVHLYGDPVDMDGVLEVAHQHDIFVIEDAAQAQGARYRGRRIGGHGHLVAWSFYPGKNLGAAGDAGAVTTDDATLAERVRVLGNYGSNRKYVHTELGVNSRLDPVQAAVLRVKLRHLDAWNARRASIAHRYRDAIPERFLLKQPINADAAHHLMVIKVNNRPALQAKLRTAGIETGIHYPTPPHRQDAYSNLAGESEWAFPNAERLSETVLSLPMGPHLPLDAVDRVLEVLVPLLEG